MATLWRCEICGDPYIADEAPANCAFCGAKKKYMKDAKNAKVDFNLNLSDRDVSNAKHALEVELSNSSFYFCAAQKTDDAYGKILFKALAKVEAEHASIWKKILKLDKVPQAVESCFGSNKENLRESHSRETKAIDFYAKAAKESENKRLKQIFEALVEVETDHLQFSL